MRQRRRQKKQLASEINVVPYIDVMLVLLVIFMITAPMMTQGVHVDLPEVDSKPVSNDKPDKTLFVYVLKDGSYGLNTGEEKSLEKLSLDAIGQTVGKIIAASPKTPVFLEGDAEVPYAKVAKVMGVLQSVGVRNLSLITDPQEVQ